MKNSLSLLLGSFLLLASLSSLADTCPRLQDFNYVQPPKGWSFLIGPDFIETYTFSAAIHFLGALYHEQVVCRYEACSSSFCPAFTLISDKAYQEPSEPKAPWNHYSVLGHSLTCMPADHDPAHCIFQ